MRIDLLCWYDWSWWYLLCFPLKLSVVRCCTGQSWCKSCRSNENNILFSCEKGYAIYERQYRWQLNGYFLNYWTDNMRMFEKRGKRLSILRHSFDSMRLGRYVGQNTREKKKITNRMWGKYGILSFKFLIITS